MAESYCAESYSKPTDDEFWGEFHSDGHHNSLEGVEVVCICHATFGPWDVYRARGTSEMSVSTLKEYHLTIQVQDPRHKTAYHRTDRKGRKFPVRIGVERCIVRSDRR